MWYLGRKTGRQHLGQIIAGREPITPHVPELMGWERADTLGRRKTIDMARGPARAVGGDHAHAPPPDGDDGVRAGGRTRACASFPSTGGWLGLQAGDRGEGNNLEHRSRESPARARDPQLPGVTGFLGKVALTMLLDRYPEVGKLYVLVAAPRRWHRPTTGSSGRSRRLRPSAPCASGTATFRRVPSRKNASRWPADVTDPLLGLSARQVRRPEGKGSPA